LIEKERTRRIVDELLIYYLKHNIEQFNVQVNYEERQVAVEIQGQCEKEPADLDLFSQMLKIPRNPNIEGYYDELLGVHDSSRTKPDYQHLGMLIDQAEVNYENNNLQVKLIRKF